MKITGRVTVKLNGQVLLNKAGAKAIGIGVNGKLAVEKKPVMGDGGIHGYTEEPFAPSCEVTVTDRDDVMLSDILDIHENGTIIFESAGGGKVYTMDGATSSMRTDVTAGEGETPLVFFGPAWIEGVQ